MSKKQSPIPFFIGLIMFLFAGPAAADKKDFNDILNVMRCNSQWDFTTYAHSYRTQGLSRNDASKKMFTNWIRPSDKKAFKDIITDAIHGAVDHVYRQKTNPAKMSGILNSTNSSYLGCIQDKGLQRYQRHMKVASTKAGLVTLWDYYKRKGIKKEQILAQSKKMPVRLKKLLDAVYSEGFNLHKYRIRKIWNPTTDAISKRFHGVDVKR